MNDLILTGSGSELTLSGTNGRLLALRVDGRNLLTESETAFALRFRLPDGEFLCLDDADFTDFALEGDCGVWSGCGRVPGLVFRLGVRSAPDGFRFRPALAGIPETLRPDFIEAPRVTVPPEYELFYPYSEGVLVSDREKQRRQRRHLQFPDNCASGYYPGVCQMQFMAAYDETSGIYYAADDVAHATKMIEFSLDAPGKLGLRIETACGMAEPDGSCTLPFELLLRPFRGDWMDACAFHREQVKRDPVTERPFPLPEWLDDSPVTIIYPVRGRGTISAEPNRFLPYENTFPRIQELAEAFDSRVMALLMRWDQHGPWLPPYYWPPAGGEESFLRFRDLLHGAGHLLGVYGSGTAYTLQSKVNGYSGREIYEAQHLDRLMTRGPRGEAAMVICSAIREGEAFCIAETESRKIMAEQVRLLTEAGVDYAQFFDQNLGCASFLCYRDDHPHPPTPGAWQTDAMRNFLRELNTQIRQSGSAMILGTECAAATPYAAYLPFNDLRDHFALDNGKAVPAYQFVFHRYANNFFGNQCDIVKRIDCEAVPDNLQFRLAKGFCAGDMLSVALRDSGEIDWGAASDWSRPAPPQEPLIRLIRNLNRTRRSYADFLAGGEMEKPFCRVECGTYRLPFRSDTLEYPSVPDSSWSAADGRRMQFLVNFREHPETVRLTPRSGFLARPAGETEFRSGTFPLELPPLSAVALEITGEGRTNDAGGRLKA